MFQLCSSCVPVAFRLRSGCVPVAFRLRSGCVPVAFRLRSGCVPVAFRLCSGCVPVAFRLRSGCVPVAFRLRSGCVPVAFRLRSGCVPVAFRLRSGAFQLRSGCVPVAFRLRSGCVPVAFRLRSGWVPVAFRLRSGCVPVVFQLGNPFSYPEAPKSSQNIGIYDVFATPKKAHVAKTPLFATLWQDNMSEMLYFTVFLNHLLKNTGIYSVFRKHMHKTPQIATNSKIASSMAISHKKQKHGYLQRFCAMIFAKNVLFGQFLASEASQKQRRGVPPTALPHLKFSDIYQVKNMLIFGARDAPGTSFFDGIYDVFCTSLNFFSLKNATSKMIKKSLKNPFPHGV